MKKVLISAVAVLALSAVSVGAQERQGQRGGGQGGPPAATQTAPGGGAIRGGGEMRGGGALRGGGELRGGGQIRGGAEFRGGIQRDARPDTRMQRGPRIGGEPRMQYQRGERQVQRNWTGGTRYIQRGDRDWRRGDRNWRYRSGMRWRGPAAATGFVFLGGPRIVVRGYGAGWCRGLHRGYHWAPRLGWHRGTHRGLFRC